MFYEIKVPDPRPDQEKVSALVVLNPSESRRLLAKATVLLPEVQKARRNGTIFIARGITNAYVTEELLGISIEPKAGQSRGLICQGITNSHTGPPPYPCQVIRKGKAVEGADLAAEVLSFGPEDVFIKGANAVDMAGNAGIFVASSKGGTIGMCWPVITPRGSHFIVPVGLEKLIPSVSEAARHTGIYHFKYSTGLPARIIPVELAKVVTEIQALNLLAGVRAYHVASGGVGGSEGAVILSLEGDETGIGKALTLIKTVKGEPPVTLPDHFSIRSADDYRYDAKAQLDTLKGF